MKNYVKIRAYPSIPIIFLGGIRKDRTPIYNTMGLAVTDLEEKTYSETEITVLPESHGITFLFAGNPLSGKKGEDTLNSIKDFLKKHKIRTGLKIESDNYNILSGSSDAGLSALFVGLDAVTEAHAPKEELARYAMRGSESAIRSFLGGMSEIVVDNGPVHGVPIASAEQLADVRIFALTFDYPSRITADEIHVGIVTHPWYKHRVAQVPKWIAKIKAALKKKDLSSVLKTAEENVRNAHYLLEEVGIRVRKREMMDACIDVEEIRKTGLPAYFLIGGGNLISVATLKQYANDVEKELLKRGWKPKKYRVAGGPKITELK